MRDLILIAVVFGGLLVALRYPFAGLLLWAWFTLATPHQAAYFASSIPLNAIIAAVTILSFFIHNEISRVKPGVLMGLMAAFGFWLWLSQVQSLDPDYSAEFFDRFIKILVFILLCMMMVTTRLRFHALLWLFAIIMGFYGAKGGVFTLLTFGQATYYGLPDTLLYDNNHMGIALAASLPVFFYLQGQAAHPIVRRVIQVVLVLSVIAILGTHSRGAFVGLAVFGLLMAIRSWRNLALGGLALAVTAPAAVLLLPDAWFERMSTIQNAAQDESFRGRLDAWEINWKLALEHPITGAGLRNPYQEEIARQVDQFLEPRAAHSIYFEIVGGAGFVGLFLYLALIGSAVLATLIIQQRCAKNPALAWRADFAGNARVSLLVFCVAAASVSMEMWEGYLLLIALISSLQTMGASERRPAPGTAAEERTDRAAQGASIAENARSAPASGARSYTVKE